MRGIISNFLSNSHLLNQKRQELNIVNLLNYFGEVIMVKLREGSECPLIGDKCLEAFCEWWILEENMCSVTNIARALNTQKKLI
jgi:hypothetical protein